ncbi:WD40-repeat-containing domain protein [Xylogone sp. PMI_703]|nr:WD40-repeat-containing domain protein [Xylogone sp. PMI_703]
MSVTSEERSRRGCRVPKLSVVDHQRSARPSSVRRDELNGERYDIQGLDWEKIGVTRAEARHMRRETYKNYTNLQIHPRLHAREERTILSDHENFFRFRRLDSTHNVNLSHFQLRNLLACSSRNQVFYAGRSEILRVDTLTEETSPDYSTTNDLEPRNYGTIMDLTDPDVQGASLYGNGIQVSTLTVAHDILVAGGFAGEYAMLNLRGSKSTKHVEGLITDHINGITNHIEVNLSRGSSLPRAAFASNDNGVRILDIGTNKFIAHHKYDHAINCTAGSPDHRLRVLVGDNRKVLICNAETGEILQELEGHRDYGFACDWASDGVTVATGNQDMLVKIWDARKWTTTSGAPYPVATIQADMAGVRKLKFSPLGSGKRVLVAAEPADTLSIIDAETFSTKQTLDFFGEIGGFDFANNGQDLIVANCDSMRGGLVMFERCGHASEALYATDREDRRRGRAYRGCGRSHAGYDWMADVNEITTHPRVTRTARYRERKAAYLGSLGEF